MNAPTLILLVTLSADPICMAMEVDDQFNAQVAGTVHTIAALPNGQILVGGEFNGVNGAARPNLARLDRDGSLDGGFNLSVDGAVFCLASRDDGSFYAGGAFNSPGRHLFRLLPNGQLDAGLDPGASTGSRIHCLAPAPEGGFFIGGPFLRFDHGAANYIAKLTATGALDSAFDPGLSQAFALEAGVGAIALQPDGKVLLAGIVGVEDESACLIRLNPDGSIDQSFSGDHGAMLYPKCIRLLEGGKMLVAGAGPDGGGFVRRLRPDGSVDPTFAAPEFGDSIETLAIEPDGKILLGGNFEGKLARLDAAGALDPMWTIAANGAVKIIVHESNGNLLIGGAFSHIGGREQRGIARITNARFQTFATNENGRFVARLRGEPGRTYQIEFSEDLRGWSDHSTSVASESGLEITDPALAHKHRFFRARKVD